LFSVSVQAAKIINIEATSYETSATNSCNNVMIWQSSSGNRRNSCV